MGHCRGCAVYSNEQTCFVCGKPYGTVRTPERDQQYVALYRRDPDAAVEWHGETFPPEPDGMPCPV